MGDADAAGEGEGETDNGEVSNIDFGVGDVGEIGAGEQRYGGFGDPGSISPDIGEGLLSAPDVSGSEAGGSSMTTEGEVEASETEAQDEAHAKKKTRARRHRSLLTEEEGGTLKTQPTYKRSILGR